VLLLLLLSPCCLQDLLPLLAPCCSLPVTPRPLPLLLLLLLLGGRWPLLLLLLLGCTWPLLLLLVWLLLLVAATTASANTSCSSSKQIRRRWCRPCCPLHGPTVLLPLWLLLLLLTAVVQLRGLQRLLLLLHLLLLHLLLLHLLLLHLLLLVLLHKACEGVSATAVEVPVGRQAVTTLWAIQSILTTRVLTSTNALLVLVLLLLLQVALLYPRLLSSRHLLLLLVVCCSRCCFAPSLAPATTLWSLPARYPHPRSCPRCCCCCFVKVAAGSVGFSMMVGMHLCIHKSSSTIECLFTPTLGSSSGSRRCRHTGSSAAARPCSS
jgi:hypothetical protein